MNKLLKGKRIYLCIVIAAIMIITSCADTADEKQYQFPLTVEDIEAVLAEQGIDMYVEDSSTIDETTNGPSLKDTIINITTLRNSDNVMLGISSQVRKNHRHMNLTWHLPKALSSEQVDDFFHNELSKQFELAGIFYGNKKELDKELKILLDYYLEGENYNNSSYWNKRVGNDHLTIKRNINTLSTISMMILPNELYEDYLKTSNDFLKESAMDEGIIIHEGSIAEMEKAATEDDEVKHFEINGHLKNIKGNRAAPKKLVNMESRYLVPNKETYLNARLVDDTGSVDVFLQMTSLNDDELAKERCHNVVVLYNDGEPVYVVRSSTIKSEKEESKAEDDIDRSEYLTGEIIVDGNYSYPPNYIGILYFVPDEESSEIIKEKYNETGESLQIKYEDASKVENLPKELGIYKVKVSVELDENRWLELKDIQLTDKIGTVLYEGKTYETNELDENVKVKDRVCGLIVKWISREKDSDGIQIRFAGEIESEGYYSINYNDMYDDNTGRIHFDEETFNNIPFYKERGFNNFYFLKTNELFEELRDFSAFGRGKFKTSNYVLIYNVGMGRPVSDYLTEIVSLDEAYKDMFSFEKNKYAGPIGTSKDFVIVSSAVYDENQNHVMTDYYYINKENPEKIFVFSSGSYGYRLSLAVNENEFILSTDGRNYMTGDNDGAHDIICKISEKVAEAAQIEGLALDEERMDEDGKKFIMWGNISDIKINESKVMLTLKDIKMTDEDADSFESADILIVDYNRNGPFIKVGDRVLIACRYTKDGDLLYSFSDEISIRN